MKALKECTVSRDWTWQPVALALVHHGVEMKCSKLQNVVLFGKLEWGRVSIWFEEVEIG